MKGKPPSSSHSGYKYKDEILWDGKFKDGVQAPIGEYFITLKVSDTAGNETMKTCVVSVGLFSSWKDIPAFIPPSSNTIVAPQTNQVIPVAPSFGGITTTNEVPPTISVMLGGEGGTSAGAYPSVITTSTGGEGNKLPIAQSSASFGVSSTTNPQSTNLPTSTILWGSLAAAATRAFLADIQKKKEEEKAAQEAERLANIEKKDKSQEPMSYAQIGKAYQASLNAFEEQLRDSGLTPEQAQAARKQALLSGSIPSVTAAIESISSSERYCWQIGQEG